MEKYLKYNMVFIGELDNHTAYRLPIGFDEIPDLEEKEKVKKRTLKLIEEKLYPEIFNNVQTYLNVNTSFKVIRFDTNFVSKEQCVEFIRFERKNGEITINAQNTDKIAMVESADAGTTGDRIE